MRIGVCVSARQQADEYIYSADTSFPGVALMESGPKCSQRELLDCIIFLLKQSGETLSKSEYLLQEM